MRAINSIVICFGRWCVSCNKDTAATDGREGHLRHITRAYFLACLAWRIGNGLSSTMDGAVPRQTFSRLPRTKFVVIARENNLSSKP